MKCLLQSYMALSVDSFSQTQRSLLPTTSRSYLFEDLDPRIVSKTLKLQNHLFKDNWIVTKLLELNLYFLELRCLNVYFFHSHIFFTMVCGLPIWAFGHNPLKVSLFGGKCPLKLVSSLKEGTTCVFGFQPQPFECSLSICKVCPKHDPPAIAVVPPPSFNGVPHENEVLYTN